MPISSPSGLLDNVFSGFFGRSIKNPFWLALIITVLIIVITLLIYPAKKSAPITKLFKLMIYIFVSSLILLFLHDSALKSEWKKDHDDQNQKETIGGLSNFIQQTPTENQEIIPRIAHNNLINPQNLAPSL